MDSQQISLPGFWRDRLVAAGIHFVLSLTIAMLAAWLVFGLWYPYPYREISGGRTLFLIVVAVDVVMGPLLTLTVFNRKKPGAELRRDLSVVGLLQVLALAYGLWTVSLARPVHLAFEIDRFRVVHAVDVPRDDLAKAPADLRALPWTGPTTLSLRAFQNAEESMQMTLAAVQGVSLGARPELWRPYTDGKSDVLAHARPLADLKRRFPARAGDVDQALQSALGVVTPGTVAYVPMVGRETFWTVLVNSQTAEVLAFVPIDSF